MNEYMNKIKEGKKENGNYQVSERKMSEKDLI